MARRLGLWLAGCVIAAAALSVAPADASTLVQEDFQITGEVDGLYPGIETTVLVTITNPQAFAIEVTSVAVTALDAGADCPRSVLEFGNPTTTVEIQPGATATVSLAVQLDLDAPDACQGATWPLVFTGTAVSDAAPGPPPGGGPGSGSGSGSGSSSGSGGGDVAFSGADVIGLALSGLALLAIGLVTVRRTSKTSGRDEDQRSP